MADNSEQIPQDDLWMEYGKIGFDCTTEGCDGLVYLNLHETRCHRCDTDYGLEVTVYV